MFSYGVNGGCVHLHLPTDLHESISTRGLSKTVDLVNLYLLDAIDKIVELRDSGNIEFQGTDSIYMISPILLKRELKFLEDLDFTTRTYTKGELNDDNVIKENKEAILATHIFGKDKSVGTAKISIETVYQKQWQDKKKRKIEEFAVRGIRIEHNENEDKETFQNELSTKVNSIEEETNFYLGRNSEGHMKVSEQIHEEL